LEAYDAAHSFDQFFQRSLGYLINKSKEASIQDVRGNRQPISINNETDFENIVEEYIGFVAIFFMAPKTQMT
jgi:hypothetical protein